MNKKILEVKNLKTYFETRNGTVKALDGVDLSLSQGDTLGIVGESGCGKTVLSLSIMRLIPTPPGKIIDGAILFHGTNLLSLDADEMRKIRGKEISMIFQEPMNSLNPVLRVGDQLSEVSMLHLGLSKHEAMNHSLEMLQLVGIPSPGERLKDYPHQMSGGMRQRVMIAMALACKPKLMLADEPTTALDVTIQAQILDLMNNLKSEVGTSIILITHDLGVIRETAQLTAVMYAGKVVEYAHSDDLFSNPLHPYTKGLMESTPEFGKTPDRNARLEVIPGSVPNLYALSGGCSFRDRCPCAMDICGEKEPEIKEESHDHQVRCWKFP